MLKSDQTQKNSIKKLALRAICITSSSIALLNLSGCAEIQSPLKPSPFSEANIDKLSVGMSSSEVRQIFGAPNEVRTAVCGAATGKPWNCETWRYQLRSNSYMSNRFTFSVDGKNKYLNDWDVKRE